MSQNRTEQPTKRTLERARERGDVAQSRDLTSAVTLIAVVGTSAVAGPMILSNFGDFCAACWDFASQERGDITGRIARVAVAALGAVAPIVPIFLAAFTAAWITPLVQVRPLFTLQSLQPDLMRLDFISGFKRVFGGLRTLVELGKSIAKMLVIGLIAGLLIRKEISGIVRTSLLGTEAAWLYAATLVLKVSVGTLAAFVGLALVDVVYQNWQFLRDKRMTKEEVKRERDDQFGKAEHRAARERLRQELEQSLMLADSRTASVFVANPTHIICALRYDPAQEKAPRVVAKGSGPVAERLRAIAYEENIPLMYNVALARALFELPIYDTVSPTLYYAVRVVLQWVEEVLISRGQEPPWYDFENQSRQ